MSPDLHAQGAPAPRDLADERYRPLFVLSPQAAWLYDRESLQFLEVNEAAIHAYGWSREEFLSMTIRDIRPPSAQLELDVMLVQADSLGRNSVRSVHRTKSGQLRSVEITSHPLEFGSRPARMVLVHDVTERDAAERALADSELKYRSVIEQMQDVFFRTDAQGVLTFLNGAWTSFTANAVEASLGTQHLSYVHPSDRRSLLDATRPLVDGTGDRVSVALRYFHRDGGHRWAEASITPIRDANGAFNGTTGTLRDVTERRAAEDEREALATNIRQLLESAGEGIFGLDKNGNITFVNRQGCILFGFTAGELIGKGMHEMTHHSRADGTPYPKHECPVQRAARDGVFCEIEGEVMWRKDGSSVQVEYTASPVFIQKRHTGAVVNIRDITARRRNELELILARDAAQAASRAKSDFLARMSHELRTPLNSIIGFANVLLKNRRGALVAEESSFLSRIATNGKHLLGLINDILDLSKIEAGRMTLEMSSVMLDTLVRETVEELEGQIADKPVVLRMELPDIIQSIDTDEARTKQILINLLGNAIKFTDTGEIVVSLEADAVGRPTRLIVRDTGIGIPEDRLAAVFNVFEQAESSTSRRFGGTGLGLAISRSLCELMGHHLEVDSVEGQGTTMRIRLGGTIRAWRRSTPIHSTLAPVTPRKSGELSPIVLVVDDDPDARELLSQHIIETGCRVQFASSGIDGLRLARELSPAMIFLDLRLPRISGFDVLRILRSDESLHDTPVVIVSAAGNESRDALKEATAIIDKPVTREQVFALIRKWLPSVPI